MTRRREIFPALFGRVGDSSFELTECRRLIGSSCRDRPSPRAGAYELDDVVVHPVQHGSTPEPVDEQLSVLVSSSSGRSGTCCEPRVHLLPARRQRDLDEGRLRVACQPFELDEELTPSDELGDDDVVASAQDRMSHADGDLPCEQTGLGRLVGPRAEQATDDVDVKVQRQRVRGHEPRRQR